MPEKCSYEKCDAAASVTIRCPDDGPLPSVRPCSSCAFKALTVALALGIPVVTIEDSAHA